MYRLSTRSKKSGISLIEVLLVLALLALTTMPMAIIVQAMSQASKGGSVASTRTLIINNILATIDPQNPNFNFDSNDVNTPGYNDTAKQQLVLNGQAASESGETIPYMRKVDITNSNAFHRRVYIYLYKSMNDADNSPSYRTVQDYYLDEVRLDNGATGWHIDQSNRSWAQDSANGGTSGMQYDATKKRQGLVDNTKAVMSNTASTVTQTSDSALYKTWAETTASTASTTVSFSYNFDVDPGTYSVQLYFAENDPSVDNTTAGNRRRLNALIEGTQVLTDFSPWAAAGGNLKGVAQTFTTTMTDNVLTVAIQNSSTTDKKARLNGILIRKMGSSPTTSSAVDCGDIQSQIMAGNISGVTDADLKAYASQGCMVKSTPPGSPSSPGVTPGDGTSNPTGTYTTTASCSSGSATVTGSYGVLNFGDITGSCAKTLSTSSDFGLVRVNNIQNTSSGTGLIITRNSPAEYQVNQLGAASYDTDTQLNGSGMVDNGSTFRVNTVTNGATLTGGKGVDSFFITTVSAGAFIYGDSSSCSGTSCNPDTMWLRNISWVSGTARNTEINARPGNDSIYFANADGSGVNIMGYDGNDIIACTDVLGSGLCNGMSNGAKVDGDGNATTTNSGKDFISIDGTVSAANSQTKNTEVFGKEKINIVYVKGINDTSTTYKVDISATNDASAGNSLCILGSGGIVNTGSSGSQSSISAAGSNNVLLVPSGTDLSVLNVSGFARTLYY